MTYEEIIQFRGHERPGLTMGYRMATAAMNKLDSIRAEDEEIIKGGQHGRRIDWF
jgi:formylmethanofuran dehydrogenase subunit E